MAPRPANDSGAKASPVLAPVKGAAASAPKAKPSSTIALLSSPDRNLAATSDSADLASPASPRSTDAQLKLQRAADQFVITDRAKLDIVQSQVASFFEILCVKLREKVVLDLAARPSAQGYLFASQLPGRWQLATLLALALGQLKAMKGLGRRAAAIVLSCATLDFAYRETIAVSLRARRTNLSTAFCPNQGSQETASLHTDRAIRGVAQTITLRHIDQIVPLTKPSQSVLAQVMAAHIAAHLERRPVGYENESRAPVVALAQHLCHQAVSRYHALFTPADRVPSAKTLGLADRCVRALTCETCPEDALELEFEPFFASTSALGSRPWTAGGVLSKSGLKVGDLRFAHAECDADTYGYVYGSEREAFERGMKLASKL